MTSGSALFISLSANPLLQFSTACMLVLPMSAKKTKEEGNATKRSRKVGSRISTSCQPEDHLRTSKNTKNGTKVGKEMGHTQKKKRKKKRSRSGCKYSNFFFKRKKKAISFAMFEQEKPHQSPSLSTCCKRLRACITCITISRVFLIKNYLMLPYCKNEPPSPTPPPIPTPAWPPKVTSPAKNAASN